MPTFPVLRRFEITVLADNHPPSDVSQVPALATINFFKQGATVRTGVTVPYDPSTDPQLTEVVVWNGGTIQIGDQLEVEASGLTLGVGDVDFSDPTNVKVYVFNDSVPSGIPLSAGQRLIRLTDRPYVFVDPAGLVATGDNYIQTDFNTGRANCYLRDYRFDYYVTPAGRDTRVYVDAEGSFAAR